MIKNGFFIAEDDITQTLADGRTIQLAAKGVEIPVAVARSMGLIKDGESGPSEFKSAAEREAYLQEQRRATTTPVQPVVTTAASDAAVQLDDAAARAIRSPKRPNS